MPEPISRPMSTGARLVPVAILMALAVSGCRRGGAPSNGLVHVANLGRSDASFHWESPGIFGTMVFGGSGTEPIRGCSLYSRGFPPGEEQITITAGETPRTFTLVGPPTGQAILWAVIDKDGTIEEIAEPKVPASPSCGE
ncbi:MAG: hypothetical protein ABI562_03775 [Chloroflexota bacterium]